MTAARGSKGVSPWGDSLRRWWLLAVLVAAVVAVAIAGGARDSGLPFDPRSTGPAGARALVDVLDELGVDVRITADSPGDDVDVALVIRDAYDDAERARLLEWVAAGGRLVVADPASPLTPQVAGTTALGFTQPSIAARCELPALAGVERISATGGRVYELGGGTGCFPRGDGYWLVVTEEGEGELIALGAAEPLVNTLLLDHDNVELAVALLAPTRDATVSVLEARQLGGLTPLDALVPPQVRVALWVGLAAFVVYAIGRARRLGAPVAERLPVELPASDTVIAAGNLLARSGARAHAAEALREDLRRELTLRFGLPATLAPDALAATIADRSGGGADRSRRIVAVLTGPPPVNDDALVALGIELDAVRHEAMAVPARSPT